MLKTRTIEAGRDGAFGRARKAMAEGIAILAVSAASCATPGGRESGSLDNLENALRESRVIVAPYEGTMVGASVIIFEAARVGNETSGEYVRDLEVECGRAEPGAVYGCVCGRSMDRSPELNLRTLRNAVISFEYFEPQADGSGTWRLVPGCESVVADRTSVDSAILSSVEPENIPHYAECDLSPVSGAGRVMIRATFHPQEGQGIATSSAELEFTRP